MNDNDRIAANVARIREQVSAAAVRSGRTADDVRLVAVTKYVRTETAALLVDAGCRDLGESRPQELWHKAETISNEQVRWHLIGHLQRNKIRRTLPLVALLHSIDSEKSLAAVDRIAGELKLSPRVLIEVNVSGDASKHGISPRDAPALLRAAAPLTHVRIAGLMCMASLEGADDVARRNFVDLRELRGKLQTDCPDNVCLKELSMGMSADFQIAIEEGATIVRIGSALYEGISRA